MPLTRLVSLNRKAERARVPLWVREALDLANGVCEGSEFSAPTTGYAERRRTAAQRFDSVPTVAKTPGHPVEALDPPRVVPYRRQRLGSLPA